MIWAPTSIEVVGIERLDRRVRAHRHEDRRLDLAVRRVQVAESRARRSVGRRGHEDVEGDRRFGRLRPSSDLLALERQDTDQDRNDQVHEDQREGDLEWHGPQEDLESDRAAPAAEARPGAGQRVEDVAADADRQELEPLRADRLETVLPKPSIAKARAE